MSILLDTVALVRWLEWPPPSPQSLKTRLGLTPASLPVAVSVASIWEAAIKKALKKLDVPDDLPGLVVSHADFRLLPITPAHAWRTRALPVFKDHKDPFDRMLVAQALEEGLDIATPDPHFARYGVKIVW